MGNDRLCVNSYTPPRIDSVVLCKENHKFCSFVEKQSACEYYEAMDNKEELVENGDIYEA